MMKQCVNFIPTDYLNKRVFKQHMEDIHPSVYLQLLSETVTGYIFSVPCFLLFYCVKIMIRIMFSTSIYETVLWVFGMGTTL